MLKKTIYWLRFGLTITAVLLPHSLLGQEPPSHAELVPEGWYVYSASSLTNLDQSTRRCFSYSHNDWQVAHDGDAITITKRIRQKDRAASLPPLPPFLKHEGGMPGRTVDAGLQSATHFGNAWLVAYDAGEWGGGLWLTNEDGSETKQILAENVHAVVPVDDGILVLSGLSHLGIDVGNAFIFSRPDGLSISVRENLRLNGAPRAFVKEPDGSVLFVTTNGLCRITKSGVLQNLVTFPEWTRFQYANSMVIASDASIFVGMRMVVLRLSAISDGYSQEWLLPTECRRFSLKQTDCICNP
jgi:hypothetical protein